MRCASLLVIVAACAPSEPEADGGSAPSAPTESTPGLTPPVVTWPSRTTGTTGTTGHTGHTGHTAARDTTGTAGNTADTAGTVVSTASDTGRHTGTPLLLAIEPLYDADTVLGADTWFDRGDAIVTRFGDRGRDRHAREDEFQSYDHYLPLYWEYRTARLQIVDTVAKGGSTLEVSYVTQWPLTIPEFRAWYLGLGTVASYSGNYANSVVEDGPGTYDVDHELVSPVGTEHRYTVTIDTAFGLDGVPVPLAVGQTMEIELSQFLEAVPSGRANYYGTTFLYAVGTGGLLPWEPVGDFADPGSERENSHPLDEAAWSGGRTTLHAATAGEDDAHFLQMATNLAGVHAQPFVRGRRVHHTDMHDGTHDESVDNGVFSELVGLSGPRYVHTSCDGCHHRNGRAPVPEVGETLTQWVVKVGAADGSPDPDQGRVLQPVGVGVSGESAPFIERWDDLPDGTRLPVLGFDGAVPAAYSVRIAPQLVGMGLLEAIDEADVLALEDPFDLDGDGISGRAQRVVDPETGVGRLGRFGWRAGTSSVRHQVAAALRTDMGVTTSVFPDPDCGSAQVDCGSAGAELDDAALDDLVLYVSLLGVRPRRDLDAGLVVQGEVLFDDLGCAGCHTPSFTTSAYHPLPELRGQAIQPYTDLLLHDMGPELADSLGEGVASGSEWRTAPLWSLGLGPCVTGGGTGPAQAQVCTPHESYLHDGRARTLDEAVRWHGGEGAEARDAYLAASAADQDALWAFVRSL